MRILFIGIFIILGIQSLIGQNQKEGLILTSENYETIEGAHILNVSNGKLAFSSGNGKFEIISEIGDTLSVSYVGFKSNHLIVEDFDFQLITLVPDIIELNEVRVTNFPEDENQFKRKIINQGIVEIDSFIPFGVTPGKPKGKIPKLYERESDILFGANEEFDPTLTIPLSYFTKKFSKKHKAKRDYYELKASKDQQILNQKKYNKELIERLTGLKPEEIMDFMSFMNLDSDFITAATDYEIAKKIIDSYKEYSLKLD